MPTARSCRTASVSLSSASRLSPISHPACIASFTFPARRCPVSACLSTCVRILPQRLGIPRARCLLDLLRFERAGQLLPVGRVGDLLQTLQDVRRARAAFSAHPSPFISVTLHSGRLDFLQAVCPVIMRIARPCRVFLLLLDSMRNAEVTCHDDPFVFSDSSTARTARHGACHPASSSRRRVPSSATASGGHAAFGKRCFRNLRRSTVCAATATGKAGGIPSCCCSSRLDGVKFLPHARAPWYSVEVCARRPASRPPIYAGRGHGALRAHAPRHERNHTGTGNVVNPATAASGPACTIRLHRVGGRLPSALSASTPSPRHKFMRPRPLTGGRM